MHKIREEKNVRRAPNPGNEFSPNSSSEGRMIITFRIIPLHYHQTLNHQERFTYEHDNFLNIKQNILLHFSKKI